MALMTDVIQAGTNAGRPAAATANAGYLYYETDTEKLFRSNGSAWVQVAAAATVSGGSMAKWQAQVIATAVYDGLVLHHVLFKG